MALTIKLLKGLGIDEEKSETIIAAHTETIDGLKAARDQYKEQAEKVPDLQRQLEEAKADTSLADLQKQYEKAKSELEKAQRELGEVKTEYGQYKEGVEARESERAKAKAYRNQILGAAKIAPSYIEDVMAVTKLDSLELDDDGNVKDADKLVEAAKDKWKSFVVQTKTDPAQVQTPPSQNDGINGVDGAHERAIQIARERHERMYGKSKE